MVYRCFIPIKLHGLNKNFQYFITSKHCATLQFFKLGKLRIFKNRFVNILVQLLKDLTKLLVDFVVIHY